MMVLSTHPKQINFSESYETELSNVWEEKQDPILWSKKDTKLDRRNRVRNEKIAKLREPFLSEIKGRKHYYGVSEPYDYKSEEHRQQYYEILKAAGLLKQEQEEQENLYDADGYYNTSVRRLDIDAKHEPTKQELWIQENRNLSELGGMEVRL
jgi:hypothetical protein